MENNRDRQVLLKIREHCQNIASHVERCASEEQFLSDLLYQHAIAFSLLQLGELINEELSEEFRKSYPQQPWRDIINLRHRIVHHYSSTDDSLLWVIAVNSVPDLLQFTNRELGSVSKMNL